jgi:hypothetical protein
MSVGQQDYQYRTGALRISLKKIDNYLHFQARADAPLLFLAKSTDSTRESRKPNIAAG